jgi:transcriptional regulator GlxA family with amidase domain
MKSTINGLLDTFYLANDIALRENFEHVFEAYTVNEENLANLKADIIIVPPGLTSEYFKDPDPNIADLLAQHHSRGTKLCAVCGGAFILAHTGLLNGRRATTHWQLADELQARFPEIEVIGQKMLVNDIDIITTGGIMSWIDLALELVLMHTTPHIMRELGRYLIVDTGAREQRFYKSFKPVTNHGDRAILKAQQHLQAYYHTPVSIAALAEMSHLGERTFLRRFVRATGIKPKDYLQRLRVQKACELLEDHRCSVEEVALKVGYHDISSFRKTFIKNMGLTPSEFNHRFCGMRAAMQMPIQNQAAG